MIGRIFENESLHIQKLLYGKLFLRLKIFQTKRLKEKKETSQKKDKFLRKRMKASDFRSVWGDEKMEREAGPPPQQHVSSMITSLPQTDRYYPPPPDPPPSHEDEIFALVSRLGVAVSVLLSILFLYVSRINRELREVREALNRLR